jgi:hypothetical protein
MAPQVGKLIQRVSTLKHLYFVLIFMGIERTADRLRKVRRILWANLCRIALCQLRHEGAFCHSVMYTGSKVQGTLTNSTWALKKPQEMRSGRVLADEH